MIINNRFDVGDEVYLVSGQRVKIVSVYAMHNEYGTVVDYGVSYLNGSCQREFVAGERLLVDTLAEIHPSPHYFQD